MLQTMGNPQTIGISVLCITCCSTILLVLLQLFRLLKPGNPFQLIWQEPACAGRKNVLATLPNFTKTVLTVKEIHFSPPSTTNYIGTPLFSPHGCSSVEEAGHQAKSPSQL